jgi:hypothetical protein
MLKVSVVEVIREGLMHPLSLHNLLGTLACYIAMWLGLSAYTKAARTGGHHPSNVNLQF